MTTAIDEKRKFKTCPTCGKVVLARGLGGHMWGVHSTRQGARVQLDETLIRLDRIEAMVLRLVEGLQSGGPVVTMASNRKGEKVKVKQVFWREPAADNLPVEKPESFSGLTNEDLGKAVDMMKERANRRLES
jgi:hypothetical protein